MTKTARIVVELVVGAILFLGQALHLAAQSNVSFQYFYDDLGQLTNVVDSTGTVIEYVYDPVGNILQIKRSNVAPGTLAIFNFTPQSGGPTQIVTIQGQAFDPTPANDIVQFNGTTAPVLSASTTTLTVAVPAAASTGPISVTVSGQTATSSTNFTLLPLPVILSLSRKSALFNTTFSNVLATGINLSGATFTFQPPGLAVTSAVIDPTGTSATLGLKVGSQSGTFALVATSNAGGSSSTPGPNNRFTVVNPASTAISASGVPEVLDALYGVDPLDPNSVPVLPSLAGAAESPAFTVLNTNATHIPAATFQAESPSFTVLNGSVSPPASGSFQTESPTFSVLNSSASVPKTTTFTVESPLFSLLNGGASTANTFAAGSSFFSLLNSHAANSDSAGPFTAESLRNPSQQAATASVPAKEQKPASKILRMTASADRAKARKAQTVSTGVTAKKKPSFASSSLTSPETETKSNDQQGVTHDSQHK